MSLALFIDLGLLALFLLTLFVCYRRGLFKSLISALKIILSLAGTYFLQDLVKPLILMIIPANFTTAANTSTLGYVGGVFNRFFQVIIGNFVTSFIIFIALFVIFTLLGNLLLELLERFVLTRALNKVGGLIIGIILGLVMTVLASYVVTVGLLMYNGTTAIMTVYNSYFLKYIVADNIQFIMSNLIR